MVELRALACVHGDRHLGPARRLYELALRPCEALLEGAVGIDLWTDGVLAHLPFPCLFDGERYLIERFELTNRSGRVGRGRRRRTAGAPSQRVVAFSAETDSRGRPPLDSVGLELEAIRQVVPDAILVRNEDFTRQRLAAELARRPSHVHIASHFDFVPAAPRRSFLTLGNGETLSLAELASESYPFRGVRCVTFSACNSATVDETEFGVEGLARLALQKGARSVVGSLWQVLDNQTGLLMKAFYQAMFASGAVRSAPVALRRSQTAFAADTRRSAAGQRNPGGIGGAETPLVLPYHWAGFSHFSPEA